MSVAEGRSLEVVREARLADLLADAVGGLREPARLDPARLEGSGVVLAEGRLWVVFDNLPLVAGLAQTLDTPDPTARLVALPRELTDLEDITYDEVTGHFYLVVEGRDTGAEHPRAMVAEFGADWRPLGHKWVDLPLAKVNKGVEGLELVRREGRPYLLGLLEGNRGLSGKAGRKPGGGRVHVLEQEEARWRSVATIHLPRSLRFRDYSAISVVGDRVAVLSQESSALWLGRLDPDGWEITDDGVVHPFPTAADGKPLYRTTEGVTWLTDGLLAVVSDRDSSRTAPLPGPRSKEQSVHVVELPPGH
jgi:hypothetical protein